jgi:leucyl-tRNA synthetase
VLAYVVLAPEHPLVAEFNEQVGNKKEVEAYLESVKSISNQDRTDAKKEKIGVCLEGIFAVNPANGESVPVWIADYVLANYGTGAVMAVPAHDERDFEFAKKYNLEIKHVVNDQKEGSFYEAETIFCNPSEGWLVNSSDFSRMSSEEARTKITEFVGGKLVTKYKMRDAIFARQRYWGEPIPLVHEKDGGISQVKEKNLPLKLPTVKSYQPSGTGESPLATVPAWVDAGYETNTMPGWAGSSWYFLRYMDPQNKKAFAGEQEIAYWKNVDMYVGGQEHATGHLLYSRFWHKFLKDLGYVKTEEPFKALRNQGLIMGPDGRKMSKRWGNVINPDDVVDQLGADTLRVYEMFMGPFESSQPWSTDSIVGARRFVERVWKLQDRVSSSKTPEAAVKALHKTIKKVTDDIANFSFNTSVSAMMICLNEMEKAEVIELSEFKKLLQILAPFAPHVTDELWSEIGEKTSIHLAPWPKYDPKKIIDDTVAMGIQVNGKVRAEISVSKDISEADVQEKVLAIPEIAKWIDGKQVRKFIFIPGKIISIVV